MNKCLQWISLTALQMALIVFPWDFLRNNTCVKVSTNKSLAEQSKSCVCFKHICKPLQQMASLCLPLQTVQTQRNCWTGLVLLTERMYPPPAELWCPTWVLDQPPSNRSNTFANFAKFDQRFCWTRSLFNITDREDVSAPCWVVMPRLINPCPTSPTVALRTMSVSTSFVWLWRAGI